MRNANGEIFYTDSYVRNEKEREFLVPARTRIGLKLLRPLYCTASRGAETWGYREFLFFRELGKVLASNSGRKN